MADDRQVWSREFRDLGAARVRSALVTGQWEREKRAAARLWIETTDALAWQEARGNSPTQSLSFMARLKGGKWWRYAAAAIGLAIGLGMIWRRLRAG